MTRRTAGLILLLIAGCSTAALRTEPDQSFRTAEAASTDAGAATGFSPSRAAPAPAADLAVAKSEAAEESPGFVTGQNPAPASPAMIIRTGRAEVKVDSLPVAIARATELVTSLGGYLANTAVQGGTAEGKHASLQLKIPADRYQGAVDRLAEIGTVQSVATYAQDVGEEFVDVTARVGNARRLEERLVTLLATRTGKLDDVLRVERELARVREEIERYEGRLRWLRTQTAMSTIELELFVPGPLVGSPGQSVLVEAFKQAWRNGVSVVAGGIAATGFLVPLVVLLVLTWLTGRAGIRRLRRRAVSAA
ncbi:MAG: DUF4349 domain-containing protein [Gemmatimonadales bacterium]